MSLVLAKYTIDTRDTANKTIQKIMPAISVAISFVVAENCGLSGIISWKGARGWVSTSASGINPEKIRKYNTERIPTINPTIAKPTQVIASTILDNPIVEPIGRKAAIMAIRVSRSRL
jgi:NhaP-type Na+/H+ or K+/H+ antiporter